MSSKGQRRVLYVRKWLEKNGYNTWSVKHYATKTESGWIHQKVDIFGCDIVAMNKEEINFYQVTSEKNLKKKLDVLKQYNWAFFVKVFVCQYKDGKYRVFRFHQGSRELIYEYTIRRGKIVEEDTGRLKYKGVR